MCLHVMLLAQVESPSIRCITVNDNETTSITWLKLNNDVFISYKLYYTTDTTSGFELITTINDINTTSYQHNNVPGGNQRAYYKLQNGDSGSFSPTKSSIRILNLVYTPDTMVNINWLNIPFNNNSPYLINKKTGDHQWDTIANTYSENYTDIFYLCEAQSLKYKILNLDTSGCFNSSPAKEISQANASNPPFTKLDSVSVNPETGKITLAWQKHPFEYVIGYTVTLWEQNSNSYDNIATVSGINNTIWDSVFTFIDTPLRLGVKIIDSCGNLNYGSSQPLSIIFSKKPSINTCKRSATLSWTSYHYPKPNELKGYKLFIFENGQLVKDTLQEDTTYVLHGLKDKSQYKYYIRAIDESGNKTSTSNQREFIFHYPRTPDSVYFHFPTIVNDNFVELKLTKYPGHYYSAYKVLRLAEDGSFFEAIDSTALGNKKVAVFKDSLAEIDSKPYYYKLQVKDSCLNLFSETIELPTISLQVESQNKQYNNLKWNHATGNSFQIEEYSIYRMIDGERLPQGPLAKIEEEPVSNYKDNLFASPNYSEFSKSEGSFHYYLITTIRYKEKLVEVSSNIAEIEKKQELYVPNAFVPGGVNSIFKPSTVFIKNEGYLFMIYNKWGIKIFETRNKEMGWDGTYNEDPMPQGVYAYFIKYKGKNGNPYEKKGTVTLIR